MIRYCYKRILLAVPVMVGISLLAFILGLLSPGDPAEFALNQDGLDAPTDAQIAMMREELGLNRPIYVQYFSWFVQVLHGNLGSSYISGKDILHELLLRLPVTVELALLALAIAAVVGIALGTLCALRCSDNLVKCFTLSSQRRRIIGIPIFCTSIFLIFFSVCCFFTLFAAIAHKTVLFCILKDLHKANNAPKVISKSFIAEVSMSDVLRPYRDLFPQIGQRVMIDDSSVVIGDVRLADDVGIWPLVVIRGDVHYVQIGARTNIQDGSMLHVTHKSSYNPDGNPLTIGEDVTVGHKVMLHGCTIGNRVLVGMGSILLDGAIVEDDVMIGAGSLVPQNKRLESGYLYLGSPVKQIRPLSDEEKAGLRYSANNYVKWKDEYLDQGNQTQP